MSDVNIVVQSKIDQSDSAITSIENQITQLSSKIKKALKLKVQVDSEQIEAVRKKIDKVKDDIHSQKTYRDSAFINTKVEFQAFEKIADKMKEIRAKVDKFAKIDIKTNDMGEVQTANLTYYNDTLKQTVIETMGWKSALQEVNGEMVSLDTFETIGYKYTDDMRKLEAETKKTTDAIKNFKLEMLGDSQGLQGKMDLLATKQKGKFNETIFNDLLRDMKAFDENSPRAMETMKELNTRFNLLVSSTQQSGSLLTRTFENAFKFLRYYVVGGILVNFIRGIKDATRYITELDSAITEIGMVTNQNREQTAGLAREYNELAKQMKVLTADITAGAVEFYRQGLKQEEVMEKLRTTTKYSKVANLDFKQSAELLTAAVNSMGVSIERASDVFLLLGDATATSGAEIAKGFQKVGGTASALGIEFEKVASYIAVISAKTRESAESIGTSLNTMFSRMSRITEAGFNEEDEVRLNDVAKALGKIGVMLTDKSGDFRNFGVILDDIANRWAGLDDQMKAYIANTIAGVRQQSKFYNLMHGYSESMDLYSKSLDAAGTTQEKYNIYLESNQATIDRLKSSIEDLRISLLNSDFLMFFVKLTTGVTDNLAALKGWNYVVIASTVSLLALALASKKMTQTNLANTFMTLSQGLIPTIGAMLGFKTSIDLTTISAVQFNVAMGGLLLLVTAVATGIGWLINAEKRQRDALEENVRALKEYESSYKVIKELTDKYYELGKTSDRTAQQQEEFLNIKQKLITLLPKSASALENENMQLSTQIGILRDLNKEQLNTLKQEARLSLMKYENKYDKAVEDAKANEEAIKKLTATYEELYKKGFSQTKEDKKRMDSITVALGILQKGHEDNKNIIESVDNARAIMNSGLEEENKALEDNLETIIKVSNSYYDLQSMQEGIVKELKKTKKEFSEINKAVEEYNKNGIISADTILSLLEKYPHLLEYLNDEKSLYDELIKLRDDKLKIL